MRISRFLCALVCATVSTVAVAQPTSMSRAELRVEFLRGGPMSEPLQQEATIARERSIPLAFAMSAVLPGSGQAYNRSWVKAAGFLAAEVAIAAGYVTSNSRGERGRDQYQNYAHQHWQPTKYGQWLNDFKDFLTLENPSRPVDAPYVQIPSGINFREPASWSPADERAVQAFFDSMRELESAVYHVATGASFAHRIPYFGDQQYYELIGKYFHFAPGWEDYPEWLRDGEFLAAIDPELQDASGHHVNVSDRYWEYRDDHQRANDYFRRASWISSFLLLNHVISAVDAAVFAKLHNDRIEARVTMEYDAFGLPSPGAYFRVRF